MTLRVAFATRFFTFLTIAFHKRYNFQIRLDIHIALNKDYSPYQIWAILSLIRYLSEGAFV